MARIKLGDVAEVWKDEPLETDKYVVFCLERPYCLQWEELPTMDNSGKVLAYGGIFCERFFTEEGRHRKVVALRERGILSLKTYEDRPLELLQQKMNLRAGYQRMVSH